MSETLKPCPFCGGEARMHDNGMEVVCVSCESCGPFCDTKAEAIAAWNARAADKPDTFHDDFYDCESTVDADEDSREKLEADIRKKQREWSQSPYSLDTNTDEVLGWLDRQAAITEREGREAWHKAASGEIYQAKQEADELRKEIVRCRDCKNYEPKDGTWLNCRFEIDGFIQWRYAEPDGFCKWNEKKENADD